VPHDESQRVHVQESRDQAGKGHSQPQGNDDAKAASSTSTNLAAAGKAVIILTAARPLLRVRDQCLPLPEKLKPQALMRRSISAQRRFADPV